MHILYEDAAVIVCVKDAGTATQTRQIGQKDMESLLRTYRMQNGETPYIGIVHRLDQPVSGVMVFAKTKEAAAVLSRQIAAKTADKYYYAMTDGIPAKKTDVLEDYLLRDGRSNVSRVVTAQTPGAKRARLSYEVLQEHAAQAIVRVRLETGRHHQIRVQMAHAGCPLVGDRKYNLKENQKTDAGALALCAYKLAFVHPTTGKRVVFEIENPFSF